ncbi:hypothetical protein [Halovenus salina]|uniref:Uncharacterized protein n=1 Tax=Halovenus salina TaxID=1510225 RepID=A0ABD5W0C9_9EURY
MIGVDASTDDVLDWLAKDNRCPRVSVPDDELLIDTYRRARNVI